MKPFVTLTGADEATKLSDLKALVKRGAEIGILYSCNPDGRNRYPGRFWTEEALIAVGRAGGRAAMHVCGSEARHQAYTGVLKLTRAMDAEWRLQINGQVGLAQLEMAANWYPDFGFVTQDSDRNADLLIDGLHVSSHSILVDGSGGKGILPEKWSRPKTKKPVGFAGGLTPENLREELPKILQVAQGDWWIDLESGLRDEDDLFSVAKAHKVLDIFEEIVK